MKTVDETINERNYRVYKMPVTQSLGMVSRLSRLLGDGFKEDSDIVEMLVSTMGKEEVIQVIKDLVTNVHYSSNGVASAIKFDDHFSDYPEDLLPVVGLSIRENVLPFFSPKALETLMQTVTGNIAE